MPRSAPPAAGEQLSWAQVHAYRISRHHLAKRVLKKDLVRAVADIGGAQAQLMSAAELQVAVRVDCKTRDVQAALWRDKTLAKTWLMRGTLHLVPADDLPLYTAAMPTRWRNINAWLKWLQLTERELNGLVSRIGDALGEQPMTRAELISIVGRGQPEHVRNVLKSGWGGLLKPVARKGLLCFGPSRGQSVTFVRPQRWLASWREIDPDKALVEVARRYLRAFGPATRDDFVRWWGMWPGVGKAAWAGLADELVQVSVEGTPAQILASDLRRVAEAPATGSALLLPSFDPYLMGHSSRDHLFDATYRWRVSRVAGWISPVVLISGRVVATWSHSITKQVLHVRVDPFLKLPPKALTDVRARAAMLGGALGATDVAVKVA